MKQILFLLFLIVSTFSIAQIPQNACSHFKNIHFDHIVNPPSFGKSASNNYDEKFVKLNLLISDENTYLSGTCTHLVKVVSTSIQKFDFDLSSALNVLAVRVNNISSTFTHVAEELSITSTTVFSKNDLVSIEIDYYGTPPSGSGFNSNTGVFSQASPSFQTKVTWTLSEPLVAKTWWPCKQILTDKIDSIEMVFTVDDDLKVGSNGILVEELNLPNNKIQYTWKSKYPIDYYLLSYAVADYEDYSYKILLNGMSDSLLIQNYIYKYPTYKSIYENDILETGDMLKIFSDKYGLYPFKNEKYGHCVAPLGGGMEHQTMTTQAYFSQGLTSHELGHQWWGDNITCSTWNDIWLNEGFASYSEYIYFQAVNGQTNADADMLGRHSHVMSQNGGSVYVYDYSVPGALFSSRLTYDKGASVVHMIRNYVNNDSLFFYILQDFQTQYSGKTVNTQDLDNKLYQKTGRFYTSFFDAWVYGEGYPVYSGEYNTKNDTLFVNIEQHSIISGSSLIYSALLGMKLYFEDGTDTIIQADNVYSSQNYYYLVEKAIDSISLDPKNWIINTSGEMVYNSTFSFSVYNAIVEIPDDVLSIQNPFNSQLDIKLNDEKIIKKISIKDISGKVVFNNNNFNKNYLSIPTLTWSKGIFILEIEINSNRFSKKLLKL